MVLTPNRRSRRARLAAVAARDRVQAIFRGNMFPADAERLRESREAVISRDQAEAREDWTHQHQLARFARFVQRDLRAIARQPRSLSHYLAACDLYRVSIGGEL